MVWLDVVSDFRIIPGMSCWVEMPKKYKEAYFKWKNRNKILGFYESNQQKLEKLWLKEIKREDLEEQKWINWMG